MQALARRAAAGNMTAAKIYLAEYRARHADAAESDFTALNEAFEGLKDDEQQS